jgi:hypothetical protein
LSGILAEESSRNILAKMSGTQVKALFITDFVPKELLVATDKQSIEIFTDQDRERVHREAEKFLHTKLAKTAVVVRKKN